MQIVGHFESEKRPFASEKWPIGGHFEFDQVKISRAHPPPKTHLLFF